MREEKRYSSLGIVSGNQDKEENKAAAELSEKTSGNHIFRGNLMLFISLQLVENRLSTVHLFSLSKII